MPRARTSTLTNAQPSLAAETVALTLPGISVAQGAVIDLSGYIDITAGTGTTAVVLRMRRGTDATGTVVGTAVTNTLAAGNRDVVSYSASDFFNNDVSGQQYVITLQQTGGTANGTFNSGNLLAVW